MIQRQTSLSINTIEFCRFLRRNNFTVSLHEEIAALKALTFIDFEEKQNFGLALKMVLCKSYPDLQAFDNLFEKYWKERDRAIDSKIKEKKSLADEKVKRDSLHALKSWLNKGVQNESEQIATYSYQEALSRKDFSTIPADEVDELIRIIKEVSRRLANRGFVTPQMVYGLLQTGDLNEDYLLELLARIDQASAEVYLHPLAADADEEERRDNPGGTDELGALLSLRVRRTIETRGFRLATYATL